MFDAAAEVAAQRRRVIWVTPAVNLYVVGVLVHRHTLSLDDVDNVGSVHHEQERSQYGPLWHAKLDDGRVRLLAAVTCAADARPGTSETMTGRRRSDQMKFADAGSGWCGPPCQIPQIGLAGLCYRR